jgi:acetyl esterase
MSPTIAAELVTVLKELARRVPPWPPDPGLADRRAALDAVYGALPLEPVAEVNDLALPGMNGIIPVRRYVPAGRCQGVVVFLHGGAWVAGGIDSHDGLCRMLANRSGAVVLNVGYRLAPEHPFPAGLDDTAVAIRWAVDEAELLGAAGGGVAIAGDSAGATLCAVAGLVLRGDVADRLALQVLVYPATDLRLCSESWTTMGDGYGLTRDEVEWSLAHYGPPDRGDWRVSPLLAVDVGGLPPALIITAECDPLRDEAEAFGCRLVAAGVRVTMHRYTGMVHGFVGLAGLNSSDAALDEIAAAVRGAVADRTG